MKFKPWFKDIICSCNLEIGAYAGIFVWWLNYDANIFIKISPTRIYIYTHYTHAFYYTHTHTYIYIHTLFYLISYIYIPNQKKKKSLVFSIKIIFDSDLS